MNHEQRQSELLELYIAALRRDINTIPPPGLDPALAVFAQKLVHSSARKSPDMRVVQARVWHRALANARYSPNGKLTQEENPMIATYPTQSRKSANPITLIAAVLALVLIGGLLIFASLRNGNNDEQTPFFGSNLDQEQDATLTATPSATFVPTATAAPSDLPVITSTPLDIQPLQPTVVPPIPGVDPNAIEVQPANASVFGFDISQAQLIVVGEPVQGTMTSQSPTVVYQIVPDQNGVVYISADSTNQVMITVGGFSISGVNPISADLAPVIGETVPGGLPAPTTLNPIRVDPAYMPQFSTGGSDAVVFTIVDQPIFVSVDAYGLSGDTTFTLNTAYADATTVNYDTATEAALDTSGFGYYSFEGRAGDVVTISVDGADGLDTRLTLINSENGFFTADDDSGDGYDPELYRIRLPFDGTYNVLVEPAIAGVTGTYALNLSRGEVLSLDEGAQQLSLNAKDTPLLVFNGNAGETVRINITVVSGTLPFGITVMQGSQVLTSVSGGGAAQQLSTTVTIPADGEVTISVTGGRPATSDGTLSLEFSIERVS